MGHVKTYAKLTQDRNAAIRLQKASRGNKHRQANKELGAHARLHKLILEELGPPVASMAAEFLQLPLQHMAWAEPSGAEGRLPRARALSAAVHMHPVSEELACLFAVPLAEACSRYVALSAARDDAEGGANAAAARDDAGALILEDPEADSLAHQFGARKPMVLLADGSTVTLARAVVEDRMVVLADGSQASAAEIPPGTPLMDGSRMPRDELEQRPDGRCPHTSLATAAVAEAWMGLCATQPKACHAPLAQRVSARRVFCRLWACPEPEVRRAGARLANCVLQALDRLEAAPGALREAEDAAGQALVWDALCRGLPQLVRACTKSTDLELVDAGLEILVTLSESRIRDVVASGAPAWCQGFLMRLALEQFLEGPNTQDPQRDYLAKKASAVLFAAYDVPEGRQAAIVDDGHVVCAMALLNCEGWIVGQTVGCVACGTLGEHNDVRATLAPLVRLLQELLNAPQATPEINLSAKIALRALTRTDPGAALDDAINSGAYRLGEELDDAGLVAVLAERPYLDEDEYQPEVDTGAFDRPIYGPPATFGDYDPIFPVPVLPKPMWLKTRPGGGHLLRVPDMGQHDHEEASQHGAPQAPAPAEPYEEFDYEEAPPPPRRRQPYAWAFSGGEGWE